MVRTVVVPLPLLIDCGSVTVPARPIVYIPVGNPAIAPFSATT